MAGLVTCYHYARTVVVFVTRAPIGSLSLIFPRVPAESRDSQTSAVLGRFHRILGILGILSVFHVHGLVSRVPNYLIQIPEILKMILKTLVVGDSQ